MEGNITLTHFSGPVILCTGAKRLVPQRDQIAMEAAGPGQGLGGAWARPVQPLFRAVLVPRNAYFVSKGHALTY